MTELELLRKARAYLPDHWTQGVDEDGDGNVCARGAILKYDADAFSTSRHRALDMLDDTAAKLYPTRSLVYVNDEIGLEAVLRIYDILIARIEEYEAESPGGVLDVREMPEPVPELATV